ncbi:hypothetical protein [Hymenobacter yonginensis]|uniref:Lipoprotein n=1 Tax=Hymenobacter yonginensis TaxID=748197 RepID=A0ABY7PMB8_9BACT|nr:hypothetical protein [Hymenobacter yonginensis]WBO84304.1 hypothetical protein O9Z63_18270 [Hymenobacter yonginensis]
MKATFRSLSLAALTGGVLLLGTASCSKDNDPAAPESVVSAEDSGAAEDETGSLNDLVEAAAPADASLPNGAVAEPADLARVLSGCATRTWDPATRTLTLDFGTTNCISPNGVAHRGKIVAVFAGPFRQQGSTVTITLVDYFRNDNQHTGTRVIRNLGDGSYSLDVQNASVIKSDGTHSWTSQRVYTRLAGQATRTILDDQYSVTGSASGTNRNRVQYSVTIQQPLLKVFTPGCARFFTAGTVNIENSRGKSLLLNYDPTGTQACDNIASVTCNGRTRTIRLGGR